MKYITDFFDPCLRQEMGRWWVDGPPLSEVDNNDAEPRVTSVCHQGRGDADDVCDVDPSALDPDGGAIGDLENYGDNVTWMEFPMIYISH